MSLSACRVQAAGGVRSDLDLPRAGFAGYVEVEQGLFATRCFAQVREEQRVAVERAAAARQALDDAGVERATFGWRKIALEGPDRGLVQAYVSANSAVGHRCEKCTLLVMQTMELALFKDGQKTLEADPELRVAMRWSETWPARSEDAAIAWGLDVKDRTLELQSLRKLPHKLQGSILLTGAVWVLPASGTPRYVYDFVVNRLSESGVCSLKCQCERHLPWPQLAGDFDQFTCEDCNEEPRLEWIGEPHTPEDQARITARGDDAVAERASPVRRLALGAQLLGHQIARRTARGIITRGVPRLATQRTRMASG